MSGKHHLSCALILAACATTAGAGAVQQPSYLPTGPELADGTALRALRTVTRQAPRQAQGAWRAFAADVGGSWLASWDEATGVPSRIFGSGIDAPGTVASADQAAAFASAFLERHIALFAPGASPRDFQLSVNHLSRGQRTVAFAQHAAGLRVIGGKVSFRFKNDRLYLIASEALPYVQVGALPSALPTAAMLSTAARGWIGSDASVDDVAGPFILPIVRAGGIVGSRVVMQVIASTISPPSRWSVFLDGKAAPVAREQLLRFATGTVLYNTPVRRPNDVRADYPARSATLLVDTAPVTTDDSGVLTFADGAPVQLTTLLDGPYVSVANQSGAGASQLFTLDAGGTVVWNGEDDPQIDSQLTSFIHTRVAKDRALALAPDLNGFVNDQLLVNVNINDLCNAFYDGQSINFYSESGPCENTGRLPDVVYHEFGHWFHHHSLVFGSGDFDGALSEGLSDFYAATITDDPAMGRGFFYTNAPLRHIDPGGQEYVWPDDIAQDPHETGLIIAGALWDLRKRLVSDLGQAEGEALTDELYAFSIRNAADIPSMYSEVLAVDDDDGNLENGTPHGCAIADTFGLHGLRTLAVEHSTLSVETPKQDGHRITVRIQGLFAECPGDAVTSAGIHWRLRRTPENESLVEMTGSPTELNGTIPSQTEGELVEFRVEVQLASGETMSFPDNPADPYYQFYIGEVTPLYCTDFETDPALDGWTHGLVAGQMEEGSDDWQWDTPVGSPQSGDPSEAFSGLRVYGNDLGHGNFNGRYKSEVTNYADSPEIDVSAFPVTRLQYRRWLNVEDAFFDKARIYGNDKPAWTNFASFGGNDQTHHQDREWRFQDIDLTPFVADSGILQVRFEIASDQGFNMGGWTIDDFCIVGTEGAPLEPLCGNGTLEVSEGCDDGNVVAGDGCSASCEEELGADPGTGFEVNDGCGCRLAPERSPRWLYLLAAASLVVATARRRGSIRRRGGRPGAAG